MSDEEILSIIAEEAGLDPALLKPEAHILFDLNLDSAQAFKVALAVSDRLEVEITDEEILDVTTVERFLQVLQAALAAKGR